MISDDDEIRNLPDVTFEAHVRIRVKAKTKMAASRKLNVVFLSSAIGVRDLDIDEFHIIEE